MFNLEPPTPKGESLSSVTLSSIRFEIHLNEELIELLKDSPLGVGGCFLNPRLYRNHRRQFALVNRLHKANAGGRVRPFINQDKCAIGRVIGIRIRKDGLGQPKRGLANLVEF